MVVKVNEKKFSLEEVLEEGTNYVTSQSLDRMRSDVERARKKQKNGGGDFRFSTLKAILACMENNQARLRAIENLLTEAKE